MIRPALLSAALLYGTLLGLVPGEHDISGRNAFLSVARAQEPAPQPETPPEPTPPSPTVTEATFGLKARYSVGEPVTVALQLPAGEKLLDVDWEMPLQYVTPPDALNVIYVWPMGSGEWPIRANYVIDASGGIKIRKHVEMLRVGDPPPPEPPKPLATLVDTATAAKLASMYAVLQTASYDSLEDFAAIHVASLEARGLTGHGAEAEIGRRLSLVASLEQLPAAIGSIIAELGVKPGPPVPPGPVVVEGKRAVIILRETEDNTPAIGLLTTALRTGETAAYIKSNGHTLDILDDDNPAPIVGKLAALGVQQPALFILDAATGAVVHSQPLPATAADVLAVLKAHGG